MQLFFDFRWSFAWKYFGFQDFGIAQIGFTCYKFGLQIEELETDPDAFVYLEVSEKVTTIYT